MTRTTSIIVTLAALAGVATACDRDPASTSTQPPAPDNTARNRQDQGTGAKTPIDQSNRGADVKITADIRRAIMDDTSMSMNAQNCKIITDERGVVTLRGPVDSQAEKDAIQAKAAAVAGVTRVVNELEVKPR